MGGLIDANRRIMTRNAFYDFARTTNLLSAKSSESDAKASADSELGVRSVHSSDFDKDGASETRASRTTSSDDGSGVGIGAGAGAGAGAGSTTKGAHIKGS